MCVYPFAMYEYLQTCGTSQSTQFIKCSSPKFLKFAPKCRYLHDVEKFDAAVFGITPAEALVLDPQQRLMLEVIIHYFEISLCFEGR